jgi:tetratricopeptide (TPR) repeat protein
MRKVGSTQLRRIDLMSKEDSEGRNLTRILFFFAPLSISMLMVAVALLTHQNLVVQLLVTIAAIPLALLAIGFVALDLGVEANARGHYALAEQLYRLAIPLMSVFRLGSIRNFQTLPTTLLAALLQLNGKLTEAQKEYEKNARRAQQGRGGKDILHEGYLITMLKDIGVMRYEAGLYPEAYSSFSRALILMLKEDYSASTTVGMPTENEVVTQEQGVGFAQLLLGQLSKPDELTNLRFPVRARTILFFGLTLCAMGSSTSGIALIDSAIKLLEERYGNCCPDMFEGYLEYALILRNSGNMEQARAYFKLAQNIAINNFNCKNPKLIRVQKQALSFQ